LIFLPSNQYRKQSIYNAKKSNQYTQKQSIYNASKIKKLSIRRHDRQKSEELTGKEGPRAYWPLTGPPERYRGKN